nr:AEC family transporter [Flavobacterium aciduliphilum]
MGLLFKLVLTPLFFFVLYRILLKQEGLEHNVSIVESAMAPMITSAIVASSYGLKPKLSSMMVAVGIPISLVTTWLWYYFLT